ncbi:MAG: hypothetical protein AAF577_16125 [Pseudomonadota bacterium]
MRSDLGPRVEVSRDTSAPALKCLTSAFHEMLAHDGFGEMRVEVRILKRGQKEVIVHFGKQYRFVVDGA